MEKENVSTQKFNLTVYIIKKNQTFDWSTNELDITSNGSCVSWLSNMLIMYDRMETN